MSTEKCHRKWIALSVLVALSCAPPVLSQSQGEAEDPVLEFYRAKAAATFEARNPLDHAVNFSLEAVTHYTNLTRRGKVASVDSVRSTYFFSFGVLDSAHLGSVENDRLEDLDFSFPNVFQPNAQFFFFPNDTGGAELAIGFEGDTSQAERPVGLAVIDRDRYFLRQLYLYYPAYQDYKKFSRSFRLTLKDGFVFPDSIWEVGAKPGIFSPEYYRLETGITAITIYR